MITLMKMFMIFNSLLTSFSLNPVKMSFLILMLSASIFFLMKLMSGSSWFPLIFLLLFMGGILIMFMILSSLMPNEKSMKTKMSSLLMIFLAMSASNYLHTMPTKESSLKWGMQSNLNMEIMIFLILGYFLGFILMISGSKVSMRSF